MSQYDKEALEKFRLSGKILRESREEMRSYVRENMSIIEVCEKAEALIKQKGGKPAFPCNVSINEVAAHYTSPPNDERRIPEKSIVKVDLGLHRLFQYRLHEHAKHCGARIESSHRQYSLRNVHFKNR